MSREEARRVAALSALVNSGDPAATDEFLVGLLEVARGTSHTTTDFGVFLGGAFWGISTVIAFLKKSKRQVNPLSITAGGAWAATPPFVESGLRFWLSTFKKWRSVSLKTEKGNLEKFADFQEGLSEILKDIDKTTL